MMTVSSDPLFQPDPLTVVEEGATKFDEIENIERQFAKLHSLHEILKNVKDQIEQVDDEINHCLNRIKLEVGVEDDVVFYPSTLPDKEVRLSRSITNKWDIEKAEQLIAAVAHAEERNELAQCIKETTTIDNRLFNKLPHGVRKHVFDALTTVPSAIKITFKDKPTHKPKKKTK
jgi:hypothetical protein